MVHSAQLVQQTTPKMEFLQVAAVFALFLAAVSGASSHFPGRYTEDNFADGNSLSPFGGNRGGGPTNWVNAVQKTGRVITATQGDRVELKCEATGSPSPSVQWFKGSRPITSLQALEETNDIGGTGLGKVFSTYVIDCILPSHMGTYTCVGMAGGKKIATPPTALIVKGNMLASCKGSQNEDKAPQIVVTRPVALEMSNNDVVLPCTARGQPKPKITWWDQNDEPVNGQRDSKLKILENGDLYISRIRWVDMGRYTCVAENELGRDSASTFLYPLKVDE